MYEECGTLELYCQTEWRQGSGRGWSCIRRKPLKMRNICPVKLCAALQGI